ncbi:hypothetical protein J2X19_002673 [Rhodoferax ferrireducens]|uniref:Tat pathway signal sequence domain protein n=1 Tax=Rhodoferax ferrireducens TaxID=192843 RepID=A0ABU2C9I0_9BURK|nr:hypothetical protein [Rhodoferax ferrireducens]MDR7377994.1 hypothetical protein [Rhodoferax ferrireducens]
MSKIENTTRPETEQADVEQTTTLNTGLASDAMARRRMLLKSLSKGSSVVAAAAIPMHTLAGTGSLAVTANGKRCTISGTMSGVHSQETIKAVCVGYSPGYYKMISHWPNYNSTTGVATNSVNGKTFTQTTSFSTIFGGGSASGLLYIMQNNPSSDEFHWIAALLNSLPGSPATNFPYTASEVLNLYTNNYANALKFFKDYMEVHT